MAAIDFDNIFSAASNLVSEQLSALRRFCALNAESENYLDKLENGQLSAFMKAIFEKVLDGCETEIELSEDEKRLRRLCLQCFVNVANRCRRHVINFFCRACRDLCDWLFNCLRHVISMLVHIFNIGKLFLKAEKCDIFS